MNVTPTPNTKPWLVGIKTIKYRLIVVIVTKEKQSKTKKKQQPKTYHLQILLSLASQ